ncbi:hypothetical protein IM538_03850 [Cytobacillus suaedae]|nr:hypothetical protein IM538_03850 [Cytobacillus suaedae]
MDFIEGWWNGVDGYYIAPTFNYKKGTIMRIYFKGDREIKPFQPETFGDFINEWRCETPDRSTRPFKVLKYFYDDLSFTVVVEVIRKRKGIDEVKHFYKDVHDGFNYHDIKIQEFTTTLIENAQ